MFCLWESIHSCFPHLNPAECYDTGMKAFCEHFLFSVVLKQRQLLMTAAHPHHLSDRCLGEFVLTDDLMNCCLDTVFHSFPFLSRLFNKMQSELLFHIDLHAQKSVFRHIKLKCSCVHALSIRVLLFAS